MTNVEKILIALMGIVLILGLLDELRPTAPQMTYKQFYAEQALRDQKDEKQAYIGSESL